MAAIFQNGGQDIEQCLEFDPQKAFMNPIKYVSLY
jgi:hypothetical protein